MAINPAGALTRGGGNWNPLEAQEVARARREFNRETPQILRARLADTEAYPAYPGENPTQRRARLSAEIGSWDSKPMAGWDAQGIAIPRMPYMASNADSPNWSFESGKPVWKPFMAGSAVTGGMNTSPQQQPLNPAGVALTTPTAQTAISPLQTQAVTPASIPKSVSFTGAQKELPYWMKRRGF